MVDYKRPKLAKVGKVGHANAGTHKALDLADMRSKVTAMTAERKGSAGTAKLRTHAEKGPRAEFGIPAMRKGPTR